MQNGSDLAVVIMAAGKGTRMKSDLPKVLHTLAGKPLLQYPVSVSKKLQARRIIVVVGHQAQRVKAAFGPDSGLDFVLQEPQLGTGHAMMMAVPALAGHHGDVLILNGDVPGLKLNTLYDLIKTHRMEGNALTVLGMDLIDPAHYGRLVKAPGGRGLCEIVEYRDANISQKEITIVNAGIYIAKLDDLVDFLPRLSTENDQNEYYITDLVKLLHDNHLRVGYSLCPDPQEVEGINSKEELARMEKLFGGSE